MLHGAGVGHSQTPNFFFLTNTGHPHVKKLPINNSLNTINGKCSKLLNICT